MTKYEKSRLETLAVRPRVKSEFLPLFDHLLVLAESSRKHGYPKRAGIELRQARQLLVKYGER